MEKLIAIFKALSDRNRLRMFAALLTQDELCACQLIELIQVKGATASRHLGILISSGLVSSRKDGRWVYYRICLDLSDSKVLLDWVKSRLAADNQVRFDLKALEEITSCDPEDLCRKQRGEACCPKH